MTYGEVVVMNKMGELFVCVPLFMRAIEPKYKITLVADLSQPSAWMFERDRKCIGIDIDWYFQEQLANGEVENLGEL